MFLSYERSLQPGLVGADLIVPVAGLVWRLRSCSFVINLTSSPASAEEAELQCHRSPDLCWVYRLVPSTLKALTIVKPETVIRWHRAGFRSYWRWKSRPRSGRPTVPAEIGRLIREMHVPFISTDGISGPHTAGAPFWTRCVAQDARSQQHD